MDQRLLLAITALAIKYPMKILYFGNVATGASPGIPLRYAYLAASDTAARMSASEYDQYMVKDLDTYSPYAPAQAGTTTLRGGQVVFRIEFSAPTPLGLLAPN